MPAARPRPVLVPGSGPGTRYSNRAPTHTRPLADPVTLCTTQGQPVPWRSGLLNRRTARPIGEFIFPAWPRRPRVAA
jgi:hypothetical protein